MREIFYLLLIKMEEVQEHDLYLNQILHDLAKKIPRMNNKKITERKITNSLQSESSTSN